MNKYVKIVVLSTLAEPKSLVKIGQVWFHNKGRLYQPEIKKEIDNAVKERLLVITDNGYYANLPVLFENIFDDTYTENEKRQIKKGHNEFYIKLGNHTRKIFLNFEAIKAITKLDFTKAQALDLDVLFELPFHINYLEGLEGLALGCTLEMTRLQTYYRVIKSLQIKHQFFFSGDSK